MEVVDEKKFSQGLDAFFHKIINALDAGKPATAPTGGSAPCDPYDVVTFDDGSFSPYDIGSVSSIEDMPPDKSVPAVMRLKAYAEHSGWKITDFLPATGGRTSMELAGHDAAADYNFRIAALTDAHRIVISVGSKCVRDPRDHRKTIRFSGDQ